MKVFQIIELVGMALILISAGWELFFTTRMDSIEAYIRRAAMNDKLDQLHYRQFESQRHFDIKVGEFRTGLQAYGTPLANAWNPLPYAEDLRRGGRQARVLRSIKLTLFVIGSVLAVAAKYFEYKGPLPHDQSTTAPQIKKVS